MFRQNPACQFVPTASCPITVDHWKALPVFFALSCYFHTLLFCGLDSPSSLWRYTPVPPSFQCCFAGLCPAAPHLPCTEEPQTELHPQWTPAERSCSSLSLLLPWWPLLQGHTAGQFQFAVSLAPRAFPEGWYPNNLPINAAFTSKQANSLIQWEGSQEWQICTA